MENGAVYNETTEQEAKRPRCRPFDCTLRRLAGWRLSVKAVQTILSLLAVICEEIVEDCSSCSGLYFFEFVSCSVLFVNLLILCVYCIVNEILEEDKLEKLNFLAMPVMGALFLLASIVFAATSSGSALESAAWVFGILASIAFAVEFAVLLYFWWRTRNTAGRSENPGNTQRTTENQPLNKQS